MTHKLNVSEYIVTWLVKALLGNDSVNTLERKQQ
jgi:hypothetical protein